MASCRVALWQALVCFFNGKFQGSYMPAIDVGILAEVTLSGVASGSFTHFVARPH